MINVKCMFGLHVWCDIPSVSKTTSCEQMCIYCCKKRYLTNDDFVY